MTSGPESSRERRLDEARRIAATPESPARARQIDRLAGILRADAGGIQVLRELLGGSVAERTLVGDCLTRWPVPLPESMFRSIEWIITDSEINESLRVHLTAILIQSRPEMDSETIESILRMLISGLDERTGSVRLRLLAAYLPRQPELATMLDQLESRIRVRCPQCGLGGDRPTLAAHVWEQHGLILDGFNVVEPWALINRRLREFQQSGNAVSLEQACALAEQIDPEGGIIRVNRLLVQGDRTDIEAMAVLRSEAMHRHASICPNCLTLVTVPETREIPPFTLSHGRFAVAGWVVDVSEHGLFQRVLRQEPGEPATITIDRNRWTNFGLIWGIAVPLMALAVLVAIGSPRKIIGPFYPTLFIVIASVAIYLIALAREHFRPSHESQIIDTIWRNIVPDWLSVRPTTDRIGRLGALLIASLECGTPELRKSLLSQVLAWLPADDHFRIRTAIFRVSMRDQASLGADPIPLLAARLAACLSGESPVEMGSDLLDGLPSKWLAGGGLARLKLLVCERAFELGWGVWELRTFARQSGWAATLWSPDDDDDTLTRWRHLHQLIPTKPWSQIGPATSVFEFARFPVLGSEVLESHPDLLWYQPVRDPALADSVDEAICVTASGLVYRQRRLHADDLPAIIRRIENDSEDGPKYELSAGPLRVQANEPPRVLGRLLDGWGDYLEREFLPEIESELAYRAPVLLGGLRWQRVCVCEGCSTRFVPTLGEPGEAIIGPLRG